MVTRAQVVAEARSWLGTKFHHQAAIKGVGCDCIGLVRGVCRDLGLRQDPQKYRHQPIGYPMESDGVVLLDACAERMEKIDLAHAKPGDIFLLQWQPSRPHHLGFLVDYRTGGLGMIHCYGGRPHGRVIEHRLDDSWRGRVFAAYRIPGLED
jgi:NlpC/P60 family putative phage cell wall peptidase